MKASRSRGRGRVLFAGVLALLAAMALAIGCGDDDDGGGDEGGGPIEFAYIAPFVGEASYVGPIQEAGCLAGQVSVNDAGGVLGRDVRCEMVEQGATQNTLVTATNELIASKPDLPVISGLGLASPVEEQLRNANSVILAADGDPRWDSDTWDKFWRIPPSDGVRARSMARWAIDNGIERAAMVFTNDPGAQGVAETLGEYFEELGGTITYDEPLAPTQPSYRAEAAAVVDSNPQAVFTETDFQTAATFWTNVRQQGGDVPPIISDSVAQIGGYVEAVTQALGDDLDLTLVLPGSGEENSAAFKEFTAGLNAPITTDRVEDPAQYETQAYTVAAYDQLIMAALAMQAADSTEPDEFNPEITEITGDPEEGGRTVVETFAQGKKALDAGEEIVYVGAGGPIEFNEAQSHIGAYEVLELNNETGEFEQTEVIPRSVILELVEAGQ